MSDETNVDGVDDTTDKPKMYTQAELDAILEKETSGLKKSNTILMDERKAAGRKAKEEEAARLEAEKEAARSSADMEGFEKSLRGEFDKERGGLTSRLELLTGRVVGESKKAALNSFSADFIAPESVDLISQLVKTEFDGENVKTQYTDFNGNVITTDAAEFKKWMGNHPALSHLMKADAASGGGATGGRSTGGARKSLKDMSEGERIKLKRDDPEAFKQLLNKR